ncbi:hypothetical protein D9M72_559900 [compost metagenome]
MPSVVRLRSGWPATPSVSPLLLVSIGFKPMIFWYQAETTGRSWTTRCAWSTCAGMARACSVGVSVMSASLGVETVAALPAQFR